MSDLVEVAFKGNRREFFRWEDVVPPPGPPTSVIVEGDRGEDLGTVHSSGVLAEKRFEGVPHGAILGAPTRRVIRTATRDEVKRAMALVDENEKARRKAIQQVKSLELQMKVTDADWQFDRRKLTLYFTAERRVDFRVLVKDLAGMFRARIELKQIGVRDEAKRLDGVGRCGRQYCSASFLQELRPVNLGVAKDQRLSLNPTQISGACGRLMCCLRYEHDFYVQSRKRFPKEGKLLQTALGEVKVLANDIFRERVTVRATDGEIHVLPLVDLRRDDATWSSAADEAAVETTHEDDGAEGVLEELPRAATHTRVPRGAASRTLPVVATPRTAAPDAPKGRPTVAPPPAQAAARPPVQNDDTVDAGLAEDDDALDDIADAVSDTSNAADGAAMPARKGRRRRGRRGGRRGRGNGSAPPGDAPAS
jgi:cell fate regulator YaaT (PSP1 superfamily)